MGIYDWNTIQKHIAQLENEGRVTRTFRRLDPDRQQLVIEAILDEAVERGPTNINIKLVAERAGVAVGSLYTYFGSRDGLLNFAVALCVRVMGDMFENSRPFLVDIPLADGLKWYLAGGVEWSKTQVGLIQFFARAAYHSDSDLSDQVVRPIASTMRDIVREMLTNAIQRGEVRADIDLDATTRLIHALTIAVGDSQILPYLNTYFQVTDEGMSSDRIVEAFVQLVLRGIRA
jgi:AcrR family transcriptional regulator